MTRKKKKKNSGQFKKGYDFRRHVLTKAERSLGYRNALAALTPQCRAKLREKVSWWYGRLRRRNLAARRQAPNPVREHEVPW